MSGPLAVSLTADISKYTAAMTRARDLAARHATDIASNFQNAAGKIDVAFAALESGKGLAALASVPSLARNAVLAFAGFAAIKLVLEETARAAKAAEERLAALVKIAQTARGAGVGTTFLQSLTGQARDLGVEAGKLTAMLEKAREASTVRIGEGGAAASSAIADRLRQNVMAGNLAQVDLNRFTGADSQEARIRVILDLLDQLRAKGAQTAALDIGERMFGAEFANQLRTGVDMIGAMRRALDGLAVGDQGRIIPPEEIQRAQAIKAQLDEITDKMETALVPLNRDIALWQAQQLQGWVDIKSQLADVVALAGKLYGVLQSVGAAMGRLGSAAPFKAMRDFLDSAGMIDQGEVTRLNRMLNGGASADAPAVPTDASAGGPLLISGIGKGRRTDTSRSLPSLTPARGGGGASTASEVSEIERFVNKLEKSAAALKAEADAFGLSNAAKATAIALAKATEIATQNGTTLTDAQTAAITKAASSASAYKDKLADLDQAQRQSAELARTLGNALSDSFADAILEGKSFSSILEDLQKQLLRMAIRAAFTGEGPLAGLFGTAPSASAGTGAVGGLAGMLRGVLGFAEGGMIQGPGTGTSDSILARVSTGEFIVNARATARHRDVLQAINSGNTPRFAKGGMVGGGSIAPASGAAPAAPNVISIAPTINLTASGGTDAQNSDLAARIGKQVENSMRGIAAGEIRAAMRPGGMMNR